MTRGFPKDLYFQYSILGSHMSIVKIFYTLLGLIATALGIIGVWVPGLPTTVFILIALWAFSHSSQRLHSWLLRVPVLKIAIAEAHRFQREGTVPRSAKIVSQTCSWLSFIGVTIALQNITISLVVGFWRCRVACLCF